MTNKVILIILAYLIGSINFSILLSKVVGGKDIRKSGSGNAGATNMLRTYGKKMGVLTLLLDVLKGIVVILICRLTDIGSEWEYIGAVGVILGHNFPLYFGFKGGKGVATSLGAALMLDWKIGLIVAVVAIGIMAITRYVSLGSIVGGIIYIIANIIYMIMFSQFNLIILICVIIMGGLLVVRHHANIKRLLRGTESKLGAK